MAGDEDIVVKIEDDTETGGTDHVVIVDETAGDKPPEKKSAADDDIVSSLRSQLAAKQSEIESVSQRATQAESIAAQAHQRASSAERAAQEAQTQAQESTRSTIKTGIAAAKAEVDAAKMAFKAAFEAGNADNLASAQERLSGAVADLRILEQTDAEFVERKPQRAEAPPPAADPVENYLKGLSPTSQNWLRNHLDYVQDGKKNAKLTAAHYDAVAGDIAPDTPAYFDFIETRLGMKEPPKKAAPEAERAPNGQFQRRPTAPAAPVTPSGGGMDGRSGQEVTLSKGEREAAVDGTHVWNYGPKKGEPIGIQEFARRKLKMKEAGLYDKSLTEQ